ncbi:hypothetical protein BDR26DRAFT_680351 [Obelidium mucronatum]|nr:hypothetical protein BDR26DRAFT_680351 [Obelidium mucronatum]
MPRSFCNFRTIPSRSSQMDFLANFNKSYDEAVFNLDCALLSHQDMTNYMFSFLDQLHPTLPSCSYPFENVDYSQFENGSLLESFKFPESPAATTISSPLLSVNSPSSSTASLYDSDDMFNFAPSPEPIQQQQQAFVIPEQQQPLSPSFSETSCFEAAVTDESECDSDFSDSNDIPPTQRKRIQKRAAASVCKNSRKSPEPSTGDRSRNFSCSVCGNSFLRKQDMQRHEATHSKVKQFVCPVKGCGFAFVRRDALSRHIKSRRCCK